MRAGSITNCNPIRIHLLLNIAARTRHSGRVSAAEREETVQARTTLLSAAALGFALLVGPARAADLPKEGTFTATFSAAGTYKPNPAGRGAVVRLLGGARLDRWRRPVRSYHLALL